MLCTKYHIWQRTDVVVCYRSWDQMGQYDAPAMIDYILETTGQEQIFWVGHSMGKPPRHTLFLSPSMGVLSG